MAANGPRADWAVLLAEFGPEPDASAVDAAPGTPRVGRGGVTGAAGDGGEAVASFVGGSASLWVAFEPYFHSSSRHN